MFVSPFIRERADVSTGRASRSLRRSLHVKDAGPDLQYSGDDLSHQKDYI